MSDFVYFIIYPEGFKDRSKLKVLELSEFSTHEISHYSRASSQKFIVRDEAVEHAKKLADKHGLEYVTDKPEDFLLD